MEDGAMKLSPQLFSSPHGSRRGVPEGLPTTITIALALGVQRLARKMPSSKTFIRRDLGSTTVIVTDKLVPTKTMTVQQPHDHAFHAM